MLIHDKCITVSLMLQMRRIHWVCKLLWKCDLIVNAPSFPLQVPKGAMVVSASDWARLQKSISSMGDAETLQQNQQLAVKRQLHDASVADSAQWGDTVQVSAVGSSYVQHVCW